MAEKIDILLALRSDVRELKQLQAENRKTARTFDELRKSGVSVGEAFKIGFGVDLVRRMNDFFARGIRSGIEFNATMESARFAVAGVLRQFDEAGRYRTFDDAMAAAAGILADIRQSAATTSANLKPLLETFTALGGIMSEANIPMEKQVALITRLSQVLGPLQLGDNQMLSEMRAMLTGENLRQSQGASSIGLSAAEIKAARETGTLFDLLMEKSAAMAEAAEEATGTFDILLSNLKDSMTQLAGEGSGGAFDAIKQSLQELIEVTQDPQARAEIKMLAEEFAALVRVALQIAEFTARNAGTIGTLLAAMVAGRIARKAAHVSTGLAQIVREIAKIAKGGPEAAKAMGDVHKNLAKLPVQLNIAGTVVAAGFFGIQYWKQWRLGVLEEMDRLREQSATKVRDMVEQARAMTSEAERQATLATYDQAIADLEKKRDELLKAADGPGDWQPAMARRELRELGGEEGIEQQLANLRRLRAALAGERGDQILEENQAAAAAAAEAEAAAERRRDLQAAASAAAARREEAEKRLADLEFAALSREEQLVALKEREQALEQARGEIQARNLADYVNPAASAADQAEQLATARNAQEVELAENLARQLETREQMRKLEETIAKERERSDEEQRAAAAAARKEALALADLRLEGVRAERAYLESVEHPSIRERERLAELLDEEKGILEELIGMYAAIAEASAGTSEGEDAANRVAALQRALRAVGTGTRSGTETPLERAQARFADFETEDARFSDLEQMWRGAEAALLDYIASVGTLEEQFAGALGTMGEALQNELVDGLTDAIWETGKLTINWDDLGKMATRTLIRIGMEMLIQKGLRSMIRTQETGEEVTAAGTRTAAKVPEATATAISGWGVPLLFGAAAIALIAGAAAAFREHGGPVEAGRPYIVGEKRPEIFVPRVSGHILRGTNEGARFPRLGGLPGPAPSAVPALSPPGAGGARQPRVNVIVVRNDQELRDRLETLEGEVQRLVR